MHARVLGTSRLTPTMMRVVLGGGDLERFSMVDSTDAYLNLAFPPVGAPYDEVFEPAQVRADHDRQWWPARRRYTVRSWDADRHRLTIDFVVHGDVGVAGAWAMRARPGDVLVFEGPSGDYRPDAEADWLLLVGDESALPAIAASLEAVPVDMPAVACVLVDGPEHELDLECPGNLALTWVHRTDDGRDQHRLAQAVRQVAYRPGRVQAFVHGEATEVRELRRHLLAERRLTRQDMSCSPYWRRDLTDEAWREVKRDFVQAMEADLQTNTEAGVVDTGSR